MSYSMQFHGRRMDDPDTKDALQFLMTREITHMKAFVAALDSMSKPALSIGNIPPTPGLLDQYFNESSGTGDDGETDSRGPWNQGNGWKYVEVPAFIIGDTEALSGRSKTVPAKAGNGRKNSGWPMPGSKKTVR